MRLSMVKKELISLLDKLNKIQVRNSSNSNNQIYYTIENWTPILSELLPAKKYDFLKTDIENLIFNDQLKADPKPVINQAAHQTFTAKMEILKNKIVAIIDLSNYIGIKDEENIFALKLPEHDLEIPKLQDIIKELSFIFSPTNPMLDSCGEIKFARVENGSSWLILALAVGFSIEPIGKFIKLCVESYKTILGLKKDNLEILLAGVELDEKTKIQIENNRKEKIRGEIVGKINVLYKNSEKQIGNEETSKLVACIEKMVDLIEMGIEVEPSLNADGDIVASFPKKEEYPQISNKKIELIENANSKNNCEKTEE